MTLSSKPVKKTAKKTTKKPATSKSKWQQSRAYTLQDPTTISIFGGNKDGIDVNSDSALTLSSVWSCVRLISETIASFPLCIYERLAESKARANEHPLYILLHDEPNTDTTSFTFWESVVHHLLLAGNAYAQIVRSNSGSVLGLNLLLPQNTFIKRVKNKDIAMLGIYDSRIETSPNDYTLIYEYKLNNGSAYLFPWDILHFKGLSYDGIVGLNPIEYMKRTVELGLHATNFGVKYYEGGATPPYIIVHPEFLGPEGVQYLMEYIEKAGKAQKPIVLEEGTKIEQLRFDADTTQFLLSRARTVNEVASFFRVPASKIGGDAPSNTYSNREADSVAFLQDSIRPWLERIEQELNRKLFSDTVYFAEFNADSYLRGDTISRYTAYGMAFGRWLFEDDIRQLENLPLRAKIEQVDPAATDQAQRSIESFSIVASEALRRMATKERNVLTRCIKEGNKQKIVEFYQTHKDYLYASLQPSIVGLANVCEADPSSADEFLRKETEEIAAKQLLESKELSEVEANYNRRQQEIDTLAKSLVTKAYNLFSGGNK